MSDRCVDMMRPGSGCALANNVAVFLGINGIVSNICDGCAYAADCEFLRHERTSARMRLIKSFGKHNFQTNAEYATEHGISKRQASKRRKKGGKES